MVIGFGPKFGQPPFLQKGCVMMKPSLITALAGAAALIAPASALAQWIPGSEIAGQSLQVTTNGVTNTVVLNPGGQAQITTPGGNVIPATWSAATSV